MLNEFLLLAIAHVFAVASPGADFALVLKNTLRAGKTAGFMTAVGVGLGILVHVSYTLLGVSFILAKSELLFSIVKFSGAAYLLWLAFKSFQSRKSTGARNASTNQGGAPLIIAFKQGFVVNVLNPKVTIFFVALFSNIVSPQTPIWLQMIYGTWLSLYTMLWFAFVAWGFSRNRVLFWYQEHGYLIDWGMGVVLLAIAIRLIL